MEREISLLIENEERFWQLDERRKVLKRRRKLGKKVRKILSYVFVALISMNIGANIQINRVNAIKDTPVFVQHQIVPEAEKEDKGAYIVKKDDTLWGIAEEVYGDGNDYIYIKNKNNLESNILCAGMELFIPTEEEKESMVIIQKPTINDNETKNKKITVTEVKSEKEVSNLEETNANENLEFYGYCKVTGYALKCSHCCDKSDGITASNKPGVAGRTVAINGLPFGTNVYVKGYGYYVVEDRGAFGNYHVDIATNTHEEALALTSKYADVEVYIVK